MNGTPFKLATYSRRSGARFPAIVLGDRAIELSHARQAHAGFKSGASRLSAVDTLQSLLENWDANFAALQEIVAFIETQGADDPRFDAIRLDALKTHAPIIRPGKMFYSAQNFRDHAEEMSRAGRPLKEGRQFTGEKATTRPYLFLKASSCLAGAFDDIVIPRGLQKIDWEAEIALAIAKPGKRIKAERALDHVAGWMTTNDVSARDLQVREDRPSVRSDWLNGKCHDKFAPMGPFLVPRAFVSDPLNLFIQLTLDGEVKQNGNTSQFIFTPEEQIEYASNILSLQSGDIFVCGTCGGVGQATHTFIQPGQVMETEIEGLGKMRNRFVADDG